MFFLQSTVEFQDIPHITLKMVANFVYCGKPDASGLSASEDGQIGFRDPNQSAQLLGGHAPIPQNLIQMYFNCHDTPPSDEQIIVLPEPLVLHQKSGKQQENQGEHNADQGKLHSGVGLGQMRKKQ